MTHIGIIVGSTRPGRKAVDVAEWVLRAGSHRRDATLEVVDLAEHDLPLLDEPVPAAMGDYRHEHTRAWAKLVGSFDGYVFVTPEYNHSVPAALKNALDYVYAEWNNKAAGCVSYGVAGGTRAAEQLRLILAELQVADVRAQVTLSLFHDFVDMNYFRPQPHQEQALAGLLDQVVVWSEALTRVRAA